MTPNRRRNLGLLLGLGIIFVVALVVPHAASADFNIKNGIVGNLNPKCAVDGNCDWCDFVQLMLVLEKVILSLFGGLALIMLIYGGQGIITAAGNQEHIKHAKSIITATLFGVGIILAGYFLVNILVGILISEPNKPLNPNLFGSSWWEAQCTEHKVSAPDFCRGKNNGTACGSSAGMVCAGEQCAVSCAGAQLVDPTGTYRCEVACLAPEVTTTFYCPNDATPSCCKT